MLAILGWIIVIGLVLSIAYSAFFHHGRYMAIVRTEISRHGTENLHRQPSRQYMWGVIVMQCVKLGMVILLIAILTGQIRL